MEGVLESGKDRDGFDETIVSGIDQTGHGWIHRPGLHEGRRTFSVRQRHVDHQARGSSAGDPNTGRWNLDEARLCYCQIVVARGDLAETEPPGLIGLSGPLDRCPGAGDNDTNVDQGDTVRAQNLTLDSSRVRGPDRASQKQRKKGPVSHPECPHGRHANR